MRPKAGCTFQNKEISRLPGVRLFAWPTFFSSIPSDSEAQRLCVHSCHCNQRSHVEPDDVEEVKDLHLEVREYTCEIFLFFCNLQDLFGQDVTDGVKDLIGTNGHDVSSSVDWVKCVWLCTLGRAFLPTLLRLQGWWVSPTGNEYPHPFLYSLSPV